MRITIKKRKSDLGSK